MSSDLALRAAPRDRLLGEMLLEAGLLGAADLERGLALQEKIGGRLGSVLMRIGAVSEDNLLQVLSRQLGLPVMGAEVPAPDEDMLRLTAAQAATGIDWLLDQQVLVWPGEGNDLFCAARDPLQPALREALRHAYPGRRVHWCLCRAQDLERMLDGLAHHARADDFFGSGDEQQLRAMAEEAPVVELVSNLMAQAVEQRASDIHLEPEERTFSVRFRIDGVLHQVYQIPMPVLNAMTSRIKILGRMDVVEKRRPQDGRVKTRTPDGLEVELRLSTLPTAFGEKLVMRIFDPDVLVRDFGELGFPAEDEARWKAMTAQPNGIILVTGPTGSGKTTTLYSTLKLLATPEVNVCTLEDPIEMIEPAFNQAQVVPDIGMTFAAGIRALMRQDPDIIMVGEVRDLETAEMAIQAALTGHLVLSTLHTNDAPTAVSRLLDLGVPGYLLNSTLLGVMAQRLVRTLCPHCKKPQDMTEADIAAWDGMVAPWKSKRPTKLYQPVGCLECRMTGYLGRVGLYEILMLSPEIRKLIGDAADLDTLRAQAVREGLRPLRLAGAMKVAQGLTTIEEVLKVAPPAAGR